MFDPDTLALAEAVLAACRSRGLITRQKLAGSGQSATVKPLNVSLASSAR
jgi:hypothetical protein